MTAITTHPMTTLESPSPTRPRRQVWKTGVVAGVAASVATSSFAALAHAAGVSFEIAGKAIPAAGFAQLTFVAAVVGTVLAVVLSRRALLPERTFVRTAIALTVVSIVPDVLVDAHTTTKLALALSHVIAAAIVIPALASRLSD